MLTYCTFEDQILVKFQAKYKHFLWRKCFCNSCVQNVDRIIMASVCYISELTWHRNWNSINDLELLYLQNVYFIFQMAQLLAHTSPANMVSFMGMT